MSKLKIVVAGSGLVATTILEKLASSEFKNEEIIVLSKNTKTIRLENDLYRPIEYGDFDADNCDYLLGATSEETIIKLAERLSKKTTLIDNSQAFRLNNSVPLVASFVNYEDLSYHNKIISNPNCVVILIAKALKKLNESFEIERIIGTSLQSVSGMGSEGLRQFNSEIDDYLYEGTIRPHFYVESKKTNLFNNLIPQIGELNSSHESHEEVKIREELQKIFHNEKLEVKMTCIRVPWMIGHAVSLELIFKKPVSYELAAELFSKDPRIIFKEVATINDVKGSSSVAISRLRADKTCLYSLSLVAIEDNLLVGAALNSLDIMTECERLKN